MPPRKLTPQTPGEPTLSPASPTETETAMPDDDPVPVVSLRPDDLPDESEIDPRTLTQPVLTRQGYVVPEV